MIKDHLSELEKDICPELQKAIKKLLCDLWRRYFDNDIKSVFCITKIENEEGLKN